MTTDGLIGGIEAGGTKIVCALASRDGRILAREQLATTSPEANGRELRNFFATALRDHGAIAAFGVGSFGPLDLDPASPAYGTITTTPKPGWSGMSWPAALSSFAAPVVVETDVDAAALGEWTQGAGQGRRTLAYTTVGTGIGTGVLHDGVPVRGFSHFETGHIPTPHDRTIDPFAGVCPYHGNCLEGLASGPAIAARWGRNLSDLGAEATELIAGYLSHLAVTLVLTHMPERLIFGGGVFAAGGLLGALRRRTAERLAGYAATGPLADMARYIVAPALGADAGIVGAIALGRAAAIASPSLRA